MIEKQEVLKIAELSKLKIEESKIDKIQKDLSQILEYVSDLKKLDTDNIPEMSHSVTIKNVEREDIPSKYNGDNLIEEKQDEYLVVKKILKDE
ncbi:MAG: Asp-tRNA(Asn)/Glu-tRNA(Gln) amidotransferase subunit GatC [Candidatus Pacebacteria bacterium]|nr:Asp-tRNA(Asn)/Glu-tRNA(Gln) amidotransferase subunit GatC [Candidatus Paceibacterota bacterium]MDD3919099.1 Asp-tRNA(Asn)/Glu-tRNA(Gln) amidotransferase subunit GatC [Candidatus Paceibacterota bacterium]